MYTKEKSLFLVHTWLKLKLFDKKYYIVILCNLNINLNLSKFLSTTVLQGTKIVGNWGFWSLKPIEMMSKGYQAINHQLEPNPKFISGYFKNQGSILYKKIGHAQGPLFGVPIPNDEDVI